jgi:DNA-nicking Smr family endonuclease
MNKYDGLRRPQAVFDFHDRGRLDGATVKRWTEDFVRRSRAAGLKRVRIVTGRGRHSAGPPLVGPQVRRTLRALQEAGEVESFGDAKIGEGAEGAVDVELSD